MDRYKILWSSTYEQFERQMNEWAGKGYVLMPASVNYSGQWFLAVMELKQ